MSLDRRGVFGVLASLFAWPFASRAKATPAPEPTPPVPEIPLPVESVRMRSKDGEVVGCLYQEENTVKVVLHSKEGWYLFTTHRGDGLPMIVAGQPGGGSAGLSMTADGLRLYVSRPDDDHGPDNPYSKRGENDIRVMVADLPELLAGDDPRIMRGPSFAPKPVRRESRPSGEA